jgi:aryl-alcohol dehydrogenase-like predicted oxidoreductase
MEPLGLRHSVEQSLLRLRTDRLDFLLLHEPRGPLVHIDVLAETATQLKQEGKIVGWGLAYNITLADIHADNLSRFDVLQFNVNISDIGYESLRLMRKDAANIFFSPFRTAPTAMSRAEVLSRLMLDFPRSVVLCSMFNPEHIRANAAAVA